MFKSIKDLFQRKTSVQSTDPIITTDPVITANNRMLHAAINSKDGNLYNEFSAIVNDFNRDTLRTSSTPSKKASLLTWKTLEVITKIIVSLGLIACQIVAFAFEGPDAILLLAMILPGLAIVINGF